jgi:hypothetical protein
MEGHAAYEEAFTGTILGTVTTFDGKRGRPMRANPFIFIGAGGENRTHKGLRPADFESAAFTYFTTPAIEVAIYSKEPALSNVKIQI